MGHVALYIALLLQHFIIKALFTLIYKTQQRQRSLLHIKSRKPFHLQVHPRCAAHLTAS